MAGEGIRNAKGKGETTRTKFMIDGREEQPDELLVQPEEREDNDSELLLGLCIWEKKLGSSKELGYKDGVVSFSSHFFFHSSFPPRTLVHADDDNLC